MFYGVSTLKHTENTSANCLEAGELIDAGVKREQVKETGEIILKDDNEKIGLKKLAIAVMALIKSKGKDA